MKELDLSDKIATVEMTITQVGVALSAIHSAIKETDNWLEEVPNGTDAHEEAKWFSKQLNDIAYNLATTLQTAEGENDND